MEGWNKCMVFLAGCRSHVLALPLAEWGSSEGENEDYYIPGVIEDTNYDSHR